MFFAFLPTNYVFADAFMGTAIEPNNILVNYVVTSEWDDYKKVEIKLTNNNSVPVTNWAIKYETDGEIINIWDAVFEKTPSRYSFKNLDYNYFESIYSKHIVITCY